MAKSTNLREFIESISYPRRETYNRDEVDYEIETRLILKIVDALPTGNDIREDKIYLLVDVNNLDNDDDSISYYDLWVRLNGEWVQIDKLDFTIENYFTKDEIIGLLNEKADKNHGHDTADIDNSEIYLNINSTLLDNQKDLNNAIDIAIGSKAPINHRSTATTYGVSDATYYGHSKASSTTPLMDGTANVGSEISSFARGNHRHPTDTSRASVDHIHGNILNDGTLTSTSSSVKNVLVTDNDNNITSTATIGSDNIANSSITESKLANNSVTSAKIKDGTITNSDIANNTITGAKLVNGTITTTQLADNSVTTDKIVDSAVTTDKINDSAITSAKISDGTITNDDIANNTITGSKLVNGTITTTQLADDSVETSKIKDGAVTTDKISDSSITSDKIVNGTITNDDIADATITGSKLVNKTITATQIADNTITNGKIANSTIETGKIKDGAITSDKILDGTITNSDIANATITGGKIAEGTITNTNLADSTIETGKIKDGAITTDKILDGTITDSDIANNTITGSKLVNGTISTTQLANNSVTTAKIKDGNVSLAKLNSDVYDSTDGGTSNSNKLITSGAVYNGLSTKANSSDVYLKTETLTTSEITQAILDGVSNVELFELKNALPTTNIKGNKFYLIPNNENINSNVYDIYIYVNNNWEQIDSLEFDISDYPTTDTVNGLLENYVTKLQSTANMNVVTGSDKKITLEAKNSHSHGNITSAGKIGSTQDLPLITGSGGTVTTGSFGTTAKTFAEGNHTHTKSAITDFPSTMTPSSHSHGQISNTGTVGSTANKPLITTTNGAVTTGTFGTSSSTSATEFVACNDTRLSDARTPTSHTHGNLQNNGQVGTTAQANYNVVTDGEGKITTEAKYSHPTYTARTGKPSSNLTPNFGDSVTVSQITSNNLGHVTGANDKTITIPDTLADGTTPGLSTNDYTGAEKTKLGGIATGANKTTIDSSVSASSTNPVQNKVIKKYIDDSIENVVSGNIDLSQTHDHDDRYYTEDEIDNIVGEYVVGTQNASTNNWTGSCTKIGSLTDGTIIYYKLPYASTNANVTLNLNLRDGSSSGAKNVYYEGTTFVKQQYPVNSVIGLIFDSTADNSSGAWRVINRYTNQNYYERLQQTTQIVAGESLTAGVLIGGVSGGLYYKIKSGLELDVRYPIVMMNTAVNSGVSINNTYQMLYSVNLQTTLANKTVTNNKQVYIEGTLNKNIFTVSSNVFVSDDNLTNDKYYIPIGASYSTYQIRFNTLHQNIYHYTTTNGLIEAGNSYNDLLDKPSSFPPSAHTNATGNNIGQSSASVFGHSKAFNGTTTAIGTTASNGTDNGLYARGDHTHNITKATVTGLGISASDHSHGNLQNNGIITTTSNSTFDYFVGLGNPSGALYKATYLNSNNVKDGTKHDNIGSSANDTQSTINTKIDTALSGKANSSHTHHDTDIDWNGTNTQNSVSPLDMAVYEEFNANRLAYLPSDNITIEYSTDGGSTWSDYGATDIQKTNLVTLGQSFINGKSSTSDYASNKLRITINAGDITSTVGANIYMNTRKLMIYMCTCNATGSKVLIEKAFYPSDTTFSTVGTYNLSGWSGWNSIPINVTFGGYSNQGSATQVKKIRLTFSCTGGTGNLNVSKLRLFGETCYTAPSNLSRNGHMYTFDENQRTYFPSTVHADNIIDNVYLNDNLELCYHLKSYYRGYTGSDDDIGELLHCGNQAFAELELTSSGLKINSSSGEKRFCFPVVNPKELQFTYVSGTLRGWFIKELYNEVSLMWGDCQSTTWKVVHEGETSTQATTTSPTATNGDIIRVVINGTNLEYYKNNTLLVTKATEGILNGKEYYFGFYTNSGRNLIIKDVIIK